MKINDTFYRSTIFVLSILILSFQLLTAEDDAKTLSNRIKDNPFQRQNYDMQKLINPKTGKIPEGINSAEYKFAQTLPKREASYGIDKKNDNSTQSVIWQNRGPQNIGGRTRALGIDKSNPNIMLAGSVAGGMWRSLDGGQSWVRTTRSDQQPNVSCVAQDPRPGFTNIWYYGTGEYILGNQMVAGGGAGAYRGDGIYKSTDNGASWFPLDATISGTPQKDDLFDLVWNIQVNKDGIVYAAIKGGVVLSNDGGNNWYWAMPEFETNQSYFTDVAIDSKGNVYAALSSIIDINNPFAVANYYGIYYYNATKHTWYTISGVGSGFPVQSSSILGRTVISIAPSKEEWVYFLSVNYGSGAKNPETDNPEWYVLAGLIIDHSSLGYQWVDLSLMIPVQPDVFGHYSSQLCYDMAIKVKPDDANTVFFAGTNLYRINTSTDLNPTDWIGGYNPQYDPSSFDNGNYLEWKNMNYPNSGWDFHTICFHPSNPNIMFTGSDHGVQKTSNCTAPGVQWENLDNGYLTTNFYCIAINESVAGDNTVIGGMQDNGTYGSKNPGDPWKWLTGGDGSFCAIPDNNNYYYVSCQKGILFRDYIDGNFNTYRMVYSAINDTTAHKDFVSQFVIDPNNNSVMYFAAINGVWRNNDITGDNASQLWEPILNAADNSSLSTIAISKNPANYLFIGTKKGLLYRVDNADWNPTPYDITNQVFPQGGYIDNIAVDPEDANKVIVVFSNYEVQSLFYTSDGGNSWTNISGNLEQNPDGSGAGPSCRTAAFLHRAGQTIYFVGTSVGLFSTTQLNGEQTVWTQEGPNSIGNVMIQMIKTRQSDGFVAVGTHANGVYTTTIPNSAEETVKPDLFYVEQNFPNPCNKTTTFNYSIPKNCHFNVKLYDINGKLINTLFDKQVYAGYYNLSFNVDNLPDGIYYYRAEAEGFSQTRAVNVAH
ncbi:MAG: T9SS type A sorting domain-containing protein [Bacteroidetes bacterium]|nr:MAG: T9SS type A sorting domain-containing protein [Bacteroidota bacterium]